MAVIPKAGFVPFKEGSKLPKTPKLSEYRPNEEAMAREILDLTRPLAASPARRIQTAELLLKRYL